jgi:hypothetical protein
MNPNITWNIINANPDKPWYYKNLLLMPPINCKPIHEEMKETIIRTALQNWFKTSAIKRQLIENVWHPRNLWKFPYLDPETFGGLADELQED